MNRLLLFFYQTLVILFLEPIRKFVKAVKMKLSVFCYTGCPSLLVSHKQESSQTEHQKGNKQCKVALLFYFLHILHWLTRRKEEIEVDLETVTCPCECSSSILQTYAYIFSSQANFLCISYLVSKSDYVISRGSPVTSVTQIVIG